MILDLAELNPQGKIILTDSRFLSDPTQSIFFAIQGTRHNGHDFIPTLIQEGIKEFVVEESALNETLISTLENANLKAYVVENSISTLQLLAQKHRSQFSYPVVAITGSNGKTIVKEWLSSLLEKDFDIVKSPRSYNSQIGVALSVWEMNAHNNLGIFEAGISMVGEMQKLEAIIQPTVGIFTNIGSSHSEGFENIEQKIREKLKLFVRAKALVYCEDYPEIVKEIHQFLLPQNPNIDLISWSKKSVVNGKAVIALHDFFGMLNLPYTDAASIENTLNAAYAGLYLLMEQNLTMDRFFDRFTFLNPIAMRLELKEGKEGNYLIDDTYNNDLGGLKMALNFMAQNHTLREKVLILSDMFQSGLSDAELRQELLMLLRPQKLHAFIGIGEKIKSLHLDLEGTEIQYYPDTESLLNSGRLEQFQKSLILLKGARVFEFEKIVDRLVKRIHGTVLEINLDAITHNLNYYRSKLKPHTRLMAMVKALAYGSGDEIAAWLQYHRVDYLTVAYPDEGIALRNNGIRLPIMVMNADPESYSTLFEYDLEPEIYSFRVLDAYLKAKALWAKDKETKIHLKIDTGMHRLGFLEEEIDALISKIQMCQNIVIASIFSHLVGADTEELNEFSKYQIQYYDRVSSKICSAVSYKPIRHICNTAGIIRFPEAQYDMVRLGIGLYGVEASGLDPQALKTVATLKTTISQIKHLPKTETVGYSRKGVLVHDATIATIAIGYADGYDRRLGGGKGSVMIGGKLCPTVGNICMDMCMVDVSGVDCKEGDEVVVFGTSPSITELAAKIGTIPYEILTGISERVKRVFYHE